MLCEKAEDLEEQMTAALETEGPVLLDVRVAAEENCYPMIPPGNAARDMVEAPRSVRE
jgi:acetolactate synthase-1/2/3 large subunit